MAENFLSFNSSEEFRKKLITRNLPPYKVEGVFSQSIGAQNYEYNPQSLNVIDSPDFDRTRQSADRLYVLNTFGPDGGFGNSINFNGPPLPVKSNSGPYEPVETNLDLVNEFYIDVAYTQNMFGPEGGFNAMYDVTDIQNNNKVYLPYWSPPSFANKDYTAYEIILLDFNNQTPASITKDSYLAQLAAKNLQNALKYRAAIITEQDVNFKTNIDGITAPDATDSALRANAPLTQRDYRITTPSENDTFLNRLGGNYIITSPIPGDYFNDDQKTRYTTSVGQLVNVLAGRSTLLGEIIGPGISRYVDASQIFLQYTNNGQKSALFGNLSFNRFRPAYSNTIAGGLFGNLLTTGINNVIDSVGTQLPGDFYLGSVISNPSFINSPVTQVPTNEFGRETGAPVFGPSEASILYEGNENKLNFGLAGKSSVDGGGITGNFIWTSPKYKDNAGFKVGVGGDPKKLDDDFNQISNQILSSESTEINFRPGSILDETQRLIDAADRVRGQARLKHVGNAINQVSKVFNDGYKEMTKGSKVLTYVDNATGQAVGQEYARVFAKDTPYYTYNDLQKNQGITTSGRRFTYSVLDNTYNLNIAPLKGTESTNIKDNKVKKYMFSIENLAWKSAGRPGLTYDSLPVCERGPNGGRIMWFPPYDIKFSETSIPQFNKTSFLGRPEPVYTYKETSRTGSLSWKIIVDHPSVLNLIVNKVFANTTTTEKANSIIDSFFAGCAKYDLYELAIRYNTIPIDQLKNYQEILSDPRLTDEEIAQQIVTTIPKDNNNTQNDNVASNVDTNQFASFENKGLYFPYDDPTSSASDYDSIYNTYITPSQNNSYYIWDGDNGVNFINNIVKSNYNDITDNLIPQLYSVLEGNEKATIEINLEGYVSNRSDETKRKNLSEDRCKVFKSYILFKNLGNGKTLSKYDTRITFNISDSGSSSTATPSGNGSPVNSCNCGAELSGSDNKFLASTMACNSSIIKKITVTAPPVVPTTDKTNPNDQTAQNPNGSAQPIKPVPGEDINDKIKKNIGKKVLRHLLSECDYFELIKESNPMFYDSMRDKLRFFDPAFHSMTPEGLNSRLTFLQQCMRPGDTIPQISENGQPKSNDAINTAFGAPPILVLRIGDFYNTKIVPNNLQLSYEPLVFDMNPEGIGVQPMIANVTLSFDFIGGSGLANPIEKLQNALSFNYYANTEIYDERADATEDTSAIDSKIFEALNKPVTKSDVNKPIENKGGTTIGSITNSQTTTVSGNTTTTGDINYEQVFDEYLGATESYFSDIPNFMKFVIDNYNYGMLMLVNSKRDYQNGSPATSSCATAKIYGKPNDVERFIGKVFNTIYDQIDNETDIIMLRLKDTGFVGADLKKIGKNYKNFVKKIEQNYSTEILNEIQTLTSKQQGYSQFYRKLNFVENGTISSFGYDGKVLSNGKTEIYTISATSLSAPSTYADTLLELRGDYNKVSTDTLNFINLLKDKNLIVDNGYDPSNSTYKIPENYNYIETPATVKVLYFGLSKMFLDPAKVEEFKKALVQGNLNTISQPSSLTEKINLVVTEIITDFEKQHKLEQKIIEEFLNGSDYPKYKKYTEVGRQKQRSFTFTLNSNPPNSIEKDLKDLYKSVNENNNKDTFIGKVTFK